jgi:RNA polymerase sigma-70 factor (ECF subfamily)
MITIDKTPIEPEEHLARDGLVSSMETLCRLHKASLFRFLSRLTHGDSRAAEDMLQETLLRAWRYMQDQPVNVEELRPWLFTVARRIAIDASRARQARPVASSDTSIDTVAASIPDEVDHLLLSLTVRQALKTLTPNHRRVLVEIFYHGRSPRETAEILGIPVGTVRSRTFYAVRALASVIGHPVDRD